MDIVKKLQKNPQEIYQEAARLLIKVAENILIDPTNKKIRTLQKSNKTISNKILNAFGGTDCLVLMGFKDHNTFFTLPEEASLEKLREVKDEIIKCQNPNIENHEATSKNNVKATAVNEKPKELIKQVVLPPFQWKYENKFLNDVAHRFHSAQIYDNKYLQERARQLIPIRQLEINAQENLRALQEEIKKGQLHDLNVTLQDMLILELLNWFKNDFFSWVDSPACVKCGASTEFSHMSTDPEMLQYTERVEMHKCESCNSITPFPRYNDLNILMETRRGRCGEWANCFTLFCRAMGWDTRHVFDETDHVWTEVYSFGEKRWLHCDPCENVCDSPLMYEAGWNKQVSYVMAYSGEEVQDVTWRYSSKHKEVLTRRNKCSEEELVMVLMELRKERQESLSESRRKYLAKRLLEELSDFLTEKQPRESDKKGRSSGSLAWRVSRGEQQISKNFTPYIWKFSDEILKENFVSICYSTALNQYERKCDTKVFVMDEWYKGVSEVDGIFRKEEKDWKMVYLARTENATLGKIKWTFEVDSSTKAFHSVDINFEYCLYENGQVNISVLDDKQAIKFLPDQKRLNTEVFSGSKKIEIVATLSGGKGDVAWQHAQLFRQSLESKEYLFNISFKFKDS